MSVPNFADIPRAGDVRPASREDGAAAAGDVAGAVG